MIDLVQLFNADLQRHKFDEYGRCGNRQKGS